MHRLAAADRTIRPSVEARRLVMDGSGTSRCMSPNQVSGTGSSDNLAPTKNHDWERSADYIGHHKSGMKCSPSQGGHIYTLSSLSGQATERGHVSPPEREDPDSRCPSLGAFVPLTHTHVRADICCDAPSGALIRAYCRTQAATWTDNAARRLREPSGMAKACYRVASCLINQRKGANSPRRFLDVVASMVV